MAAYANNIWVVKGDIMAKRGRTNLGLATILVALLGAAALAACSDDDAIPVGGGGASSGGKSGSSGGAGKSGGGNAGKGGAATGGAGAGAVAGEGGDQPQSMGGEAGASVSEAGSGGEGGDGPVSPCGPLLVKPNVANTIAVAASAQLVAAYAADGVQTYTCTASPAAGGAGGGGGSGGSSGSSGGGSGGTSGSTGGGGSGGTSGSTGGGGSGGTGGSGTTYTWSSAVPTANLYDQSCKLAATHYGGPHWKANDGSIIKGTVARTTASMTANSIALVLLNAAVDGGTTGLFTPVTAVQRLDTVGGIAPPPTACTAGNVGAMVPVHYTANYYFYSGANSVPATAP